MTTANSKRKGKVPDGKMTIGELARRTGMTIRNIRAHQTRGLLPPPEVHGRTGYYNEAHVARIKLTREMQAEGLNLEAIRRFLEGTDGSQEIVDFARAIRAPFEDETPEIFEPEEIAASWGLSKIDPKMVRHSEKLGVLRELPDGKIEVISPRLHSAATEMIGFGVSAQAGLGLADQLHKAAEGAARAYVDIFTKEIWEPFDKAGRPEEQWPKVIEALERLRPLASGALLAMFQITMGDETEKAAERTLQNAGSPPKRRKSSKSKRRASRRS
ncbi:MAG TPA: MerR family transcriptional regulator [Solirubrobacterales bacterium]|nr:MerR family transcriptional regulator [Solirubrobacterales bacterium]